MEDSKYEDNRISETRVEQSPVDLDADDDLVPRTSDLSEDEERKLLWKIDLHLMPLLFVSYMLQFLDKATLGNAAVFTLQKDIHLVGQQYSLSSSGFYFGYLAATYPASIGFVKFPLGKYLAYSVLIWSVVLACHGAASSFASLLILRILLGIFESLISPGFSLLTSIWYKPSEHVTRHTIWFLGNSVGGVLGGFLSYGIGHIKSGIAPWRWIFIIYGLITFVWSIYLIISLPDSPQTAKFLTPHERPLALVRPQKATHSFKTRQWKKSQAIEGLIDPKTWLLFLFTILTSIPNGGINAFSALIIKGIVNNTLETLLLGIPSSVVNIIILLIATYIATKLRKSRCLVMASVLCISIMGWCLVAYLPDNNKGGRLVGTFFFSAYSNAFPLGLSLIASDVAGYTKKTTVAAILFLGYCAGNIIGPQVFITREAPRYQTGCEVCIICLCLAILTTLILRQLMDRENKRRDRNQGMIIDAETASAKSLDLIDEQLDETDWENKSFRYIL